MQHFLLKCCNTNLLSRGFSKQKLLHPTLLAKRQTQFTNLLIPHHNVRLFRRKKQEHTSEEEMKEEDYSDDPFKKLDRPEDIEIEDKFGPIWINPNGVEDSKIWMKRIIVEYDPDDPLYFAKMFDKIQGEAKPFPTIRKMDPKFPLIETDQIVPHHMRNRLLQRYFRKLGEDRDNQRHGPEQSRPTQDRYHKVWLSAKEIFENYRVRPKIWTRWRKNWLLRNAGLVDDDVVDFRTSNSREYHKISRPKRPWVERPFVLRAFARIIFLIGFGCVLYVFFTSVIGWIRGTMEAAGMDKMMLMYEVYQESYNAVINDPIVQKVLGKPVQGDEGSVKTKFYAKRKECLLTFPIYGPKGRAFVTVVARRIDTGMYQITQCDVDLINGHIHRVEFEGQEGLIDLTYVMWKLQKQFEDKEAEKKAKALEGL